MRKSSTVSEIAQILARKSSIVSEIAQILAIADELAQNELSFDEVEAAGLDGTGRDLDPRFPYTWANLTDAERDAVRAFWLTQNEE